MSFVRRALEGTSSSFSDLSEHLYDPKTSQRGDPNAIELPWITIKTALFFFGLGKSKLWIRFLETISIIMMAGMATLTIIVSCGNVCTVMLTIFALSLVFAEGSMLICNIEFGFAQHQKQFIEKMIVFGMNNTDLTESQMLRVLQKLCEASAAVFIIGYIFQISVYPLAYMSYIRDKTLIETIFWWIFAPIFLFGRTVSLGTTVHLSMLWLFQNWIIQHATGHLVRNEIVEDNLYDESTPSAGRIILHLLSSMRLISMEWSLNHAVRYVLAIVAASTRIGIFIVSMNMYNTAPGVLVGVWNSSVALIYFVTIFLTTMAPGYVMDSFHNKIDCKLFKILHSDDADIILSEDTNLLLPLKSHDRISVDGKSTAVPLSTLHRPQPEKREEVMNNARALLNDISIVYGRHGMHFAGFPSTFAGSIAVSGVVVTIATTVVTYLTEPGSDQSQGPPE